jgi:hypothetical protein
MTGRRPPRRGVVLTLAAAGARWAGGAGWDGIRSWAAPAGVRGSVCAGVAGAQPYLGPRDSCGLGDMMIDGVVPLVVWPRRSLKAVRSGDAGVAAGFVRGAGHGGMATVHRLCEGRRFHPHRPHRPAGRGP